MKNCRICNNKLSNSFLSLGNSPLSNSYIKEEELEKSEPYYPLDLYFCEKCYLVQINEFEKATSIFSEDYAYYFFFSTSWVEHAKIYTENIINKLSLNHNSFVIEIASNDGYLLQFFNKKKIPNIGVEPTKGTASVAIKKGINTDICFFTEKYSEKIIKENKQADLIIGNNVLAHNPNLIDFTKGLKKALKSNGTITLEFPHLGKLIMENQFDTIYHEHFSYLSLHSTKYLLEKNGLEIYDVEELKTHGGSLRVYIKHKEDTSKKIDLNVKTLLNIEMDAGLTHIDTFKDFGEKIEKIKNDLLKLLTTLKKHNKKIVCYGAPAKGNTLLNYCGITTKLIDYTVDLNPNKQNKYLPGNHIPIKNPEIIKHDKPDYIFILPWNIKEEIFNQLKYIKEWKGKFIIAIPEIKVI